MKYKNDMEEIKIAIPSLKLRYFKGCANECPECKKKGYFGSIIQYECESGNKYLLCGWCGNVTKVSDTVKRLYPELLDKFSKNKTKILLEEQNNEHNSI